ncbi:ParB N-terminal domain-containing protein [Egbenema bharatensis]|uniref:ParB N-terminal domain-containing protein n=1 Tax=Egbenema bharatensis TaxID=3463334 RepID=UPI003A894A35
MKLSVTFVPVRKIKPGASRWNFADEQIDEAAQLIAQAEGIVQPIVLLREGEFESYVVIEGDFEYYAAVKASELEPRSCEAVPAFVIENANEADAVRQQIHLFRDHRSPTNGNQYEPEIESDTTARLSELEARQVHLEARQLTLEQQHLQELKQQVDDLKKQICPRTNLLDLFNIADHAELLHRVKRAGIAGKNAEKIVETIEYERQYRLFESLRDVVTRVKGLTYEKIVDLFESE